MPSGLRLEPLRPPCLPRFQTPPGAADPSSSLQQQQRQLPPPSSHALREGGGSFPQKQHAQQPQRSANNVQPLRPQRHLSAAGQLQPVPAPPGAAGSLRINERQVPGRRGRPNPGPAHAKSTASTTCRGCPGQIAAAQTQDVGGASIRSTTTERRDQLMGPGIARIKLKSTADPALVAHPGQYQIRSTRSEVRLALSDATSAQVAATDVQDTHRRPEGHRVAYLFDGTRHWQTFRAIDGVRQRRHAPVMRPPPSHARRTVHVRPIVRTQAATECQPARQARA